MEYSNVRQSFSSATSVIHCMRNQVRNYTCYIYDLKTWKNIASKIVYNKSEIARLAYQMVYGYSDDRCSTVSKNLHQVCRISISHFKRILLRLLENISA